MKIIAAVDGTKYSEAAIDALLGMQLRSDTEIKVLAVVPEESGFSFARLADNKNNQHQQELVENTRKALVEICAARGSALGCKLIYEVVQGDAKTQIVEAAKQWSANLIIMGSRGNKGVEMMLLGSVSQGVLNTAPCPVVVVKSDENTDSAVLQEGFKSVLIAVDNSQYSQAALSWLKGLNWASDTKMRLITIIPSLADSVNSEQDAMMVSELMLKQEATAAAANDELNSLSKTLKTCVRQENISIQVAMGDLREAILQAAASCSADLIVMGSHGRTGLTKFFIDSVSQAVAVHANCSVAIIRGIVAKGKTGALNQSGLFVAENQEELMKKYAEILKNKEGAE